jgi:hypothetical protein
MPTIPMMPGRAGGAGIGSFNIANTKPTIAPVMIDNRTNFMDIPPSIAKPSLINMA